LEQTLTSQTATVPGERNVVIQIVGDGNTVMEGRPHLRLTRYPVRRQRQKTETDLLTPYTLSIPMLGRDGARAELWSWMERGEAISIRVLIAPAGRGKTRLALELAEEAVGRGWRAGFLTGTELARFQGQQNLADWGWNAPSLIILDYAASLGLHSFLAELAENDALLDPEAGAKRPLRILLLERQATPGQGWWLTAFGRGDGAARDIAALLDPPEPIEVPPIDDPETRRRVIAEMLKRAGSEERPPDPGQDPDFDRRLAELTWGGEPLFLMMAALVAAEAGFGRVLALSRDELAIHMADRELTRIERVAQARGLAPDFARHMAAYVTLCQGLDRESALAAIKTEKDALDRPSAGDPPVILGALRDCLSTTDDALQPILPDMVGEAVLLRAFEPLGEDSSATAVLRASDHARGAVAASVIRTCQDYAIHGHATPLTWLDRLTAAGQVDLDALIEIANALPHETLVLRERAVALYATIGMLLQRVLKTCAPEEREVYLGYLAASQNNLAVKLSDLGRREEALAAAQEAVELLRELAVARPDAFQPDLAASINTLANRLSELGQREEALAAAQEAANIQRDLAAARPDAFWPHLASTLISLAPRLSELGRREEALAAAQEAADLYRGMAAARPDAFRPSLAISLNNLATMLSSLGRREEALKAAQDAADLYRELAAARPDAFRPDLAASLNNLAPRLGELGRREEALAAAQEAVDIRCKLATARPEAFRADLAQSLNNLAKALSQLGQREKALKTVQEAVDILRGLAAARPDAFRPSLATSLTNLANGLRELGRREMALKTAQEAVDILREQVAVRPDAFRPQLATSLNTLAAVLSELDRREEALDAAQEAARIYRKLAATRPDAFQPDLATSLNTLANRLREQGRREEASEVAQEVVDILRDLAAARPNAFQPDLAGSLNNLAANLSELGRFNDALWLAQEAANLYRGLAAARPDAFRADLAGSLNTVANTLSELGQREEALEVAQEAAGTLSEDFILLPAAYDQQMLMIVANYLKRLNDLGREPDMDLLQPIFQAFERLRSEEPPDETGETWTPGETGAL
jgi:tetratricopeptide (TPR) repeat protein